jgi:hypothetical protein
MKSQLETERRSIMLKKLSLFLAITTMAALAAQPAAADFWGGVNLPDWSGNAGYTNQTWTFTDAITWTDQDLDSDGDTDAGLIMPPVAADAGYTNPYSATGPMGTITYPGLYYTSYGESFAWDYIDEGPMGQDWIGLQGMIGGMGQGSIDLYTPIADVTGTTSVWVQYISYLPNGLDGSAVDAQLASDSDITNLIGTQIDKSYEQITALDDQGSTGDWWLITEEWQVAAAGDLLYLRINADAAGTSNMIDSVQVMTSAVPVPGAVWLLGGGLLGLVGLRRRSNKA